MLYLNYHFYIFMLLSLHVIRIYLILDHRRTTSPATIDALQLHVQDFHRDGWKVMYVVCVNLSKINLFIEKKAI